MSAPAEKVSEDQYAEQPALEWLTGNGWTYQHGTELGPEQTQRSAATTQTLPSRKHLNAASHV